MDIHAVPPFSTVTRQYYTVTMTRGVAFPAPCAYCAIGLTYMGLVQLCSWCRNLPVNPFAAAAPGRAIVTRSTSIPRIQVDTTTPTTRTLFPLFPYPHYKRHAVTTHVDRLPYSSRSPRMARQPPACFPALHTLPYPYSVLWFHCSCRHACHDSFCPHTVRWTDSLPFCT